MNVAFKQSFLRDVRRISDGGLVRRVKQAIERVETAGTIRDVPNAKKLRGGGRHYSVRVGT